jgi:hypothetical protein
MKKLVVVPESAMYNIPCTRIGQNIFECDHAVNALLQTCTCRLYSLTGYVESPFIVTEGYRGRSTLPDRAPGYAVLVKRTGISVQGFGIGKRDSRDWTG